MESAPSFPGPLFQNKGRCSAFGMEIIFHSHANKTHFHKKGCAPSLILKVRVFGTQKWPIHTDPTPPLTPQTIVGRVCLAFFSEFQLCVGWGEGELQKRSKRMHFFMRELRNDRKI